MQLIQHGSQAYIYFKIISNHRVKISKKKKLEKNPNLINDLMTTSVVEQHFDTATVILNCCSAFVLIRNLGVEVRQGYF